jgi:transcriptional regulator with XRE-family HTH domain
MTLNRWLRRQKISQYEAARRLKIPQSSINRITNDGLPPTLRNAAKIVRATNGEVGYEDLLGPSVTRTIWRYNGKLAAA